MACQHRIALALSVLCCIFGASCGTAIPCAASWSTYNGYCYRTGPAVSTGWNVIANWYDARDSCNAMGAHLVSIADKEENKFVTTLTGGGYSNYWIGLTNLDGDAYSTWTDGSHQTYTNWAKGAPANGRCADMSFNGNGLWDSHDCNINQFYICKRKPGHVAPVTLPPPTLQPGTCPTHFTAAPGTSLCYHVGGQTDMKTFSGAASACGALLSGSELASVRSSVDQAFLVTLLSGHTTAAWIGYRANYYGKFYWSDNNSRRLYTNWAPHQPERESWRGTGYCVSVPATGGWGTARCDARKPYVCQHRRI